MSFKQLLVSGLFLVGLFLLPFSGASHFHTEEEKLIGVEHSTSGILHRLVAQAQGEGQSSDAWSFTTVWRSVWRQIDGVLDFAAQAVQAVTDSPGQLFDITATDPPESAQDVQGLDPTINAALGLPNVPAPQYYQGVLTVNVPLRVSDQLSVGGIAALNDVTIAGTLSLANITVSGLGQFGALAAGASQLASLSVSGNTQLNTLSVTGPVNFADITAGTLLVTNTLTTQGTLSALGGLTTGGADVDLEGGNLFAANIVNDFVAGDNIELEQTGNSITISAETQRLGARVRSLNSLSGTLTLAAGDDIVVTSAASAITIANDSTLSTVAARGGCTNCILDIDVIDSLTIATGTIDNTVIGSTTPALATFTSISTTDSSATSTFGGPINVTSGCVAVNGVCLGGGVAALDDLSDVTLTGPSSGELLTFNGTQWVNGTTSDLGLGDGTYLGLSDTPASYVAGALVFASSTGGELTQSEILVFDGDNLSIGSTTPITALTVSGDVSITGGDAIRFYDPGTGNFVGFRASSSLAGDIVWTLPSADGSNNEFLVTDGAGNLRFSNLAALGVVTALDDLSDVTLTSTTTGDMLVFDGSVWVNQGTSTLGLGDGTFLGLNDTPSAYEANAVLAVNAAGDSVTQSTNFTFDGSSVAIGSTAAVSTLTVDGDISVTDRQVVRFYEAGNANYVGLRASTSVPIDIIWTLPTTDGSSDHVLVTDGSGNLRFSDVSAVGGGAETYLELNDTPGSYTANAIAYTASTSDRLLFSSSFVFNGDSGFLGIGTDTPTQELTVHGGLFVGVDANTPGIVYSTTTDQVGIGTDSPAAKLNVEGGSIVQRGGSSGNTYIPTEIASIPLDDTAYSVQVIGTRAYVTTGLNNDDFHIIDISNRTSPIELGSLDLPSNANDLYIAGKYAFVVTDATGEDFHIIDISDPVLPVEISSLEIGASAYSVDVQGNYAYVASANTGQDLTVVDISDLTAPVIVGSANLPASGFDIDVQGDRAYIVTDTGSNGFYVFDISDPTAPVELGFETLPTISRDVQVQGNYAYAVTDASSNDFHVIDISSSTVPNEVASLDLSSGAYGVSLSGNYAYVTTAGGGDDFHIIDISDPTAPFEIGSVELAAGAVLASVPRGRYAYVVSSSFGDQFHVIDITGVEAQSVLAHSMESGALSVLGELVAAGDVSLSQSLRVGEKGIQTDGSLLIQGTELSIFTGSVAIGTTTDAYQLAVEGDAIISGQLYDSAFTAGAYGQLLMANGVGQVWTSTTSLGLSEDFTTSADLASILTDETGTAGSVVFSTSPLFTGTVEVAALGASSTLSLLGTNANISLGSNYISGDGDDEGIFITGGGSVGVGTTTPASELSVEGTIMAANLYGGTINLITDAQGNIVRDTSDERLKTNIQGIEGTSALEKVLALRGVSYQWIDTKRFGPQTEIGFIAQEVDLVLPEVIRKGGDYWSINTRNILAVVVEAMQEVWRTVTGQGEQIDTLEGRVEQLETLLDVEPPVRSESAENTTTSGESNGSKVTDAATTVETGSTTSTISSATNTPSSTNDSATTSDVASTETVVTASPSVSTVSTTTDNSSADDEVEVAQTEVTAEGGGETQTSGSQTDSESSTSESSPAAETSDTTEATPGEELENVENN